MKYCLLSFLFLLGISQANDSELNLPAKIVKIHDGDTVTVEIAFEVNVRMLDCYAPELNTDDGKAAKKFLEEKLNTEKEVYVKIPFSKKIGKSISLSRFLGYIYQDVDGDGEPDNLSEVMVKAGFAKQKK